MKRKTSVWKATSEPSGFPELHQDISVDVAIVGGGITGLTCAHLLSASGIKVAVLEARKIGEGTTGFSTGNLYAMVDSRLFNLVSKYGVETCKKVTDSRAAAVDLIEQVSINYDINCDFFRSPWNLFAETDKETAIIEKEYKAAQDAGLDASLLDSVPLLFPIKSAVRVEGQAQFNPMKYVKALAKSIQNANCAIYENSRALDFKGGENCQVETPFATVRAKFIILATHSPKGVYAIHNSVFPYREDAIALRLKDLNYPPAGIYWALTENQHHSFRTYNTENDSYLVVAGEHYKVGQAEDAIAKFYQLEQFARNRFDVDRIEYQWAAQSYRSADGLPYIGEIEDNIYTGTGFSTDGLTYGTLSAMIISDLIIGNKNEWKEIYDINRHNPLKASKGYIKENLNVMGKYMQDFPGVAEAKNFDEIRTGEGKVVSVEGEKLAAFRDEDNKIHAISAVCTHMKCIVTFNNAEKSWDCPCHGSRFQLDGTVIEGPAIVDLSSKVFKKTSKL